MTEEQSNRKPQLPPELSNEEWQAWKSHPTTKTVFAYFALKRREAEEAWARGAFTGPGHFETLQRNCLALGKVQCLMEIQDLDNVALNGEVNHGE